MKKMNYKIRSLLCTAIAFSAVLIDLPNTVLWMYEPKKPEKFKNK